VPDQPQERIWADRNGLCPQLLCSSLSAQSETHALQPQFQALGPSSVGSNRWPQSLTENGTWTPWVLTTEPAHTHEQTNGDVSPRQIRNRSLIAALNARRDSATHWTMSLNIGGGNRHGNLLGLGHHFFEA